MKEITIEEISKLQINKNHKIISGYPNGIRGEIKYFIII